MKVIREALDHLGYRPVEGAKFYQFVKRLAGSKYVKVDFLGGPLGELRDASRVSVDTRRIKPKPGVGLHAHRADEAVAYDLAPIRLPFTGKRSDGESASCEVLIPQAFSYLLMKLYAFRDRKDDSAKEFAQHHARDIYRIVAMLLEHEYETVQQLAAQHRHNEHVRQASEIVSRYFVDADSLGVLRMREHPLSSGGLEVAMFVEIVRELFPS